MATILKEGKKNIVEITYYKYTCKRCGCEFEFDKNEFKRMSVDKGSFYGPVSYYDIICPHCKQHSVIPKVELDKLQKEIKEVELEWEETKDDYFERYYRQYVYR